MAGSSTSTSACGYSTPSSMPYGERLAADPVVGAGLAQVEARWSRRLEGGLAVGRGALAVHPGARRLGEGGEPGALPVRADRPVEQLPVALDGPIHEAAVDGHGGHERLLDSGPNPGSIWTERSVGKAHPEGAVQDRTPDPATLDPIETRVASTSCARCSSSGCGGRCGTPTTTCRTTGGVRRGRRAPRRLPGAGRPARGSRSPPRRTCATNYPFGMFAVPREQVVAGARLVAARPAGPPSSATPRDDIATWADADGPLDPRRRRPARRRGARRVRLRAVHRRPRRALRRRGARAARSSRSPAG